MAARNGSLGRIAVVDDEAMVRDVVQRYLVSAGYEVDTFDDGPAVLSHVRSDPPDLVVLDTSCCPVATASTCCARSGAAPTSP